MTERIFRYSPTGDHEEDGGPGAYMELYDDGQWVEIAEIAPFIQDLINYKENTKEYKIAKKLLLEMILDDNSHDLLD